MVTGPVDLGEHLCLEGGETISFFAMPSVPGECE